MCLPNMDSEFWEHFYLCSVERTKEKHFGASLLCRLSLSAFQCNCLRAFALAVISRRGSCLSSMPQAAGVNQRRSHICTSCGAIAHARVTEPSGLAGTRGLWGPRGGAGRGPNASGLSRGAQGRVPTGKAVTPHFCVHCLTLFFCSPLHPTAVSVPEPSRLPACSPHPGSLDE